MADPDAPVAVPPPEPGNGDPDPAAGENPPVTTAGAADDDWVPL